MTKVNKAQREAFIEKAKELGCDEDASAFDGALRRIVPAIPRKPPPPKGRKKPVRKRGK